MRTVQASEITKNIREMCIEANHFLSDDMKKVFNESVEKEESPLGKQILNQLQENLEIAGRDMIPICQDTGMAVVFIKVGQEVHIEGGNLTDAINEGVRQGYVDGYLRKSVVRDPIDRMNQKYPGDHPLRDRRRGPGGHHCCAEGIRKREHEPRVHVEAG